MNSEITYAGRDVNAPKTSVWAGLCFFSGTVGTPIGFVVMLVLKKILSSEIWTAVSMPTAVICWIGPIVCAFISGILTIYLIGTSQGKIRGILPTALGLIAACCWIAFIIVATYFPR